MLRVRRWAERRAIPSDSPVASIAPDTTTEHKTDSDGPPASDSDWDTSSLPASAKKKDIQPDQIDEVASDWDTSSLPASAKTRDADSVQADQTDEVASDWDTSSLPTPVQTEDEARADGVPLPADQAQEAASCGDITHLSSE
jgi:hypothetical protein